MKVFTYYNIYLAPVLNSFTVIQLLSVDVSMDLLGLCPLYMSNLRMSSVMYNDVISILGLIKTTGGSH